MNMRQAGIVIDRVATADRLRVRRGVHGPFRAGLGVLARAAFGVIAQPARGVDLESLNLRGRSGNGASSGVGLSENGTVVVFYSDASDLVPGDGNGVRDVFVHVQGAPRPELVSL